jgi:hypothetical protein
MVLVGTLNQIDDQPQQTLMAKSGLLIRENPVRFWGCGPYGLETLR